MWNAAIELAIRIFALAETGCLDRYSGLRNQIERAVVSISNNIAEGFERGTTAELISFLYIARGSAGEVRSWIDSMKNSTIPGTRYNNDQKKSAQEAAVRRDSFMTELDRVRREPTLITEADTLPPVDS